MNNDLFTAYAKPFPAEDYNNPVKGVTFSHTFVFAAPAYDWNCFGGGREQINDPTTQVLCKVNGNAAWVDKVYGAYRTNNPMGLTVRVDSVCHSVSNRILAMAGTDQDVATAQGDLFAVLLYGKYGYQLDSFIDQCKNAADELNKQQPGCVPQADVDALVARVKNEDEEEADTLKRQFTASLIGNPSSVTPDETQKIMTIYESFHTQRLAIYNSQTDKSGDFQARFAAQLKPVALKSIMSLEAELGPDRCVAIFGISAVQAVMHLIG